LWKNPTATVLRTVVIVGFKISRHRRGTIMLDGLISPKFVGIESPWTNPWDHGQLLCSVQLSGLYESRISVALQPTLRGAV
jgi:hypothetical protein